MINYKYTKNNKRIKLYERNVNTVCIVCNNYKKNKIKSNFCKRCIKYMVNNNLIENSELSQILTKDLLCNIYYKHKNKDKKYKTQNGIYFKSYHQNKYRNNKVSLLEYFSRLSSFFYINKLEDKKVDIYNLLKFIKKYFYYSYKYTNKQIIYLLIEYTERSKYEIYGLENICIKCYNNKNLINNKKNKSKYCIKCINFFSNIKDPNKIFSKYINFKNIFWYKDLYQDKLFIKKYKNIKEKK